MPYYPGTRSPRKKTVAKRATRVKVAKSAPVVAPLGSAESKPADPQPIAPPQLVRTNLFSRLGLYGLAPIAPVLLAALATEEPLLLIGPHGTAKSLLLTRIADALGLSSRHYNASLLNFDDLVGFPLPGKDGTLEYIKTPAAIWGAGAVIFDEISRCRPDIQNKLFPIIHERKVQGLPLVGLRYRWSAMNPPATDTDDNGYSGSEPLDAALADRFAFILAMPAWTSLNESEQLAVIRAVDTPLDPTASQALRSAVATVRATIAAGNDDAIDNSVTGRAAGYVRAVCTLLAQAKITLSPRRQGMLHRGIRAIQAAATITDPALSPSDCALLALRASLPNSAQGIAVDETKVYTAHREAWRLHEIDPLDPMRVILLTAEPLERLRLAIDAPSLGTNDFSTIVADSLAQLSPGARSGCILHLFEQGAAGRLNAAIADQSAIVFKGIIETRPFTDALHSGSHRYRAWTRITELLATLDPTSEDDRRHANAVVGGYRTELIATPEDAAKFFREYRRVRDQLRHAA